MKLTRISDYIPEKANRVLNIILLTLILVFLRVWHLAVVQSDQVKEEFRKPQKRMVIEPARRATIRDRFNVPLAINKIHYQAAILYSQIAQIPSVKWITDENGKKIKQFQRKEYIQKLASLLAEELKIDPERLVDLIHAKASLYYNVPFVIKEDISEKEYYRLKMLEKDWTGIYVQRLPLRTYPLGKVAGDIVGYMGAISREEYEKILHEIQLLDQFIGHLELGEEAELPEGYRSVTEVRQRLKELKEKAYTVNDKIGKTGIEGLFEEQLRGFQGRKYYYADAKGNFLRELPGSSEPLPGDRIILSLSSELQEHAEKLLAENETVRIAHLSGDEAATKEAKQPWIKGGAIVVIDPNNGEVLTLASYPRMDPNDFLFYNQPEKGAIKKANVNQWLENERHIAQIWDQRRPLTRERFQEGEGFYEETLWLTWENYLDFILPKESEVVSALNAIGNIKNAIQLQRALVEALTLSGQDNAYCLLNTLYGGEGAKKPPEPIKRQIEMHLAQNRVQLQPHRDVLDNFLGNVQNNFEKILTLDLCRLALDENLFSAELIARIGKQSISDYRIACTAYSSLEPIVKRIMKEYYHDHDFKIWRQQHEKEYIKQKRIEEKIALKRYPKPYIEYIDELENTLFSSFWEYSRWQCIDAFLFGVSSEEENNPYLEFLSVWEKEVAQGGHQEAEWIEKYLYLQKNLIHLPYSSRIAYLRTLRSFADLNRPLLGKYRQLKNQQNQQLEKHLAAAFYPKYGYGYGRSYAYRQAAAQGSIFKLVTGYTALIQRHKQLRTSSPSAAQLNPLEIVDHTQRDNSEVILGYHADGKPIPQHYKGGRLPKSTMKAIGQLDITRAIEVSSNPYFALLAGDVINPPQALAETAKQFSYGSKTGILLPGEFSGKVPLDTAENRTGLYSFAIGQHSLVVTPLQTAVMLSALANGGRVLTPKMVLSSLSTKRDEEAMKIAIPEIFPYQDSLATVGIDFPLFTSSLKRDKKDILREFPTEVKRQLFMPDVVRKILLDGMSRVVGRMYHNLTGLTKTYQNYPDLVTDFNAMKGQFVGKTSTAESLEMIDLGKTSMYTHIWFGGISFESDKERLYLAKDPYGNPELVVIVYLRHGQFGRDAAPLAAQMVVKWREILKRETKNEK